MTVERLFFTHCYTFITTYMLINFGFCPFCTTGVKILLKFLLSVRTSFHKTGLNDMFVFFTNMHKSILPFLSLSKLLSKSNLKRISI